MPDPTAIDSAKLQRTVSLLTKLLAEEDYDGMCRLARTSRLSAGDMARVVNDYGRHLIPLPTAAFRVIEAVPVLQSSPQRWSVVVPLWSKEEARSDLSLELTVEYSPAPSYSVDIEDLHVL
jgi:hypothetical protein